MCVNGLSRIRNCYGTEEKRNGSHEKVSSIRNYNRSRIEKIDHENRYNLENQEWNQRNNTQNPQRGTDLSERFVTSGRNNNCLLRLFPTSRVCGRLNSLLSHIRI